MRVSTAYTYESSIATLQRRQTDLAEAQLQMTSGKRVSKPSDDPAAMAAAERALAEEARGKTLQRSLDASRSAMTQTESALGDAIDLTSAAREALIQAGNGSYTAADRETLAVKLRQLRSQLLSVANQTDGAGGYLFAGQGAQTAPFADGADATGNPRVTSAANGGQSMASTTENLPLTLDGASVWLQAYSGNGSFITAADSGNTGSGWISAGSVVDPSKLTGGSYTVDFSVDTLGNTTYTVSPDSDGTHTGVPYKAGADITADGMRFSVSGKPGDGDSFSIEPATPSLSVFKSLDDALKVLENPTATNGQVQQVVTSGLRDLDQVVGKFQSARAMVGETLNQLDAVEDRTGARILAAQTARSNAEDLDMVQAASEFTNKQTSYQASLQAYSMVQKLSLFQYISG